MNGNGPCKLKGYLCKDPFDNFRYFFGVFIQCIFYILPFQRIHNDGLILTGTLYFNGILLNTHDLPDLTIIIQFILAGIIFHEHHLGSDL